MVGFGFDCFWWVLIISLVGLQFGLVALDWCLGWWWLAFGVVVFGLLLGLKFGFTVIVWGCLDVGTSGFPFAGGLV